MIIGHVQLSAAISLSLPHVLWQYMCTDQISYTACELAQYLYDLSGLLGLCVYVWICWGGGALSDFSLKFTLSIDIYNIYLFIAQTFIAILYLAHALPSSHCCMIFRGWCDIYGRRYILNLSTNNTYIYTAHLQAFDLTNTCTYMYA